MNRRLHEWSIVVRSRLLTILGRVLDSTLELDTPYSSSSDRGLFDKRRYGVNRVLLEVEFSFSSIAYASCLCSYLNSEINVSIFSIGLKTSFMESTAYVDAFSSTLYTVSLPIDLI